MFSGIASNAPWSNTGYGVQTRIFAPRLRDLLGYEVVISAYYGLAGATLGFAGVPVMPCYSDPFGNDLLRAHAQFAVADLVITLADVWVFDPVRMATLPWLPWTPIDHYPIPRPVEAALRGGKAVPVAMSKFGAAALTDRGYDPVFYVPHSPEHEFYEVRDKEESKAKFGWEGKFVVGVVAANKGSPSRKSFPQALEAFAKFAKGKKDVLLYLHTEPRSPWGINLDLLLDDCKVSKEQVQWVDHYRYVIGLGTPYMVDAYNAMDVLLNPSMGEGFGIPIIEAQACGVPVIVTDFSSMSELCFFGQKVSGKPFYTQQQSYQVTPDIGQIRKALEWAYQLSPAEWMEGQKRAKEAALQYHPDEITRKFWKPTLERALELMSKRDDLNYETLNINFTREIDDQKVGMDD